MQRRCSGVRGQAWYHRRSKQDGHIGKVREDGSALRCRPAKVQVDIIAAVLLSQAVSRFEKDTLQSEVLI